MSTNPAEGKKKLSKHILEMKFMQRCANKEEPSVEEENQKIIDEEHWVLDIPMSQKTVCSFITEPSFAVCENLIFGRRSFKGFNAEIEKLCKALDASQDESEQAGPEKTITDEDMAARYSSLGGTIAQKFTKRRDRSTTDDIDSSATKKLKTKVRMFLNPEDSVDT